jgi:hypothetical protein
MGVAIILELPPDPMDGAPTGTIGAGDAVVLVVSEAGVACGFCPSGRTIGVDASAPPRPVEPVAESCCGGQSIAVGGHAPALPEPDESSGGAHPAEAPKSPGVVQSAWATPVTSPPTEPTITRTDALTTATNHRRVRRTSDGFPVVLTA